jgi:competence protein ComGC
MIYLFILVVSWTVIVLLTYPVIMKEEQRVAEKEREALSGDFTEDQETSPRAWPPYIRMF